MERSLRVRHLAAMILVVTVAVSITAFVASRRATNEFESYVERGSGVQTRRFVTILARRYATTHNWNGVQSEIDQMGQAAGRRVVLADDQGLVIADSDHSANGKKVNPAWGAGADVLSSTETVGVLYLNPAGSPNPADSAFVAAINQSVLYGALTAGLLAVIVTLAMSGRILRPIEHLTAAVRRMDQGDRDVRVDVESEDEIGELARAFNAMTGSLAQQEQLRRNMVSDVAHELRTPLTNLRGYLQAARDGLLTLDRGLVDSLYEETMLLSRLVTDLQDLAQAEAGQLKLERRPVALDGIVAQAIDMLEPQVHAHKLALNAEMPPDLPPVDADPGRVGQVLRNLLNNALAHTPAGGKITVSALADTGYVMVCVSDTGEGIEPQHLPFVFDRFYRVDRSRARMTGGAGLGLAIARQLVAAMGGSISVASQPGRGSAFTFTLPIA